MARRSASAKRDDTRSKKIAFITGENPSTVASIEALMKRSILVATETKEPKGVRYGRHAPPVNTAHSLRNSHSLHLIVHSSTPQLASNHVHEGFDNPRRLHGFVRTMTKDPPDDGNCGVFALDCEMVGIMPSYILCSLCPRSMFWIQLNLARLTAPIPKCTILFKTRVR